MFDEKDLILEAKHVTRRFPAAGGRQLVACNDVNLKMYKGKTLGLVGESGCGKSTFMRFLVWLRIARLCSTSSTAVTSMPSFASAIEYRPVPAPTSSTFAPDAVKRWI